VVRKYLGMFTTKSVTHCHTTSARLRLPS